MPVTPLHLCGAALSIFGALAYQQAVRWGSRCASLSNETVTPITPFLRCAPNVNSPHTKCPFPAAWRVAPILPCR